MKHGDDNYLGDSEAGSSLPSADTSETRLVLDNAVGNSHLAAQSGQEHDQLKIQSFSVRRRDGLQIVIRGCQGCHPLAK